MSDDNGPPTTGERVRPSPSRERIASPSDATLQFRERHGPPPLLAHNVQPPLRPIVHIPRKKENKTHLIPPRRLCVCDLHFE
ncbi:hypothetical protein B0H17DRAFT_1080581, partial [Mycena rosella]